MSKNGLEVINAQRDKFDYMEKDDKQNDKIEKQVTELNKNLVATMVGVANFNDLIPTDNNITKYYFLNYSTSHTNAPSGFKAGHIITSRFNTYATQTAYAYDTNSTWTRRKVGDNWTSWATVVS